MKIQYLFVLLLSFFANHESTSQNKPVDIYLSSLSFHLDQLKAIKKGGLNSIYVEQNEVTTVGLPEELGGIKIIFLTREEIREKTRNGKRIELVAIRPVRIYPKSLVVTVLNFSVTSKRNTFNYANGGGSTLEFAYNCDDQQFELVRTQYGGI